MSGVIPTEYRGVKYRSRTEARWAVFMDALGVKHEYEAEGYDLGDGIFYLPDFWLPDLKCFIEVKPCEPTPEESAKASKLAEQTGHDVFVFFNQPMLPEIGRTCSAYIFPASGGEDHEYWWTECPACGRIDIQFLGLADRIKCRCVTAKKTYNFASPRLKSAYRTVAAHSFWRPAT